MTRRFSHAPETDRQTAEQLEAVFEHAPTGVALVAADGRLLRANPALARMLGRTVPELLKLRWQDMVHPRDRRGGEVAVRRALAGEGTIDQVFRAHHADGRELVIRVTASVIAGPPRALAVHYEDLTEQLAEATRTQVLAAVASGVSDAVVVTDTEDRIVFVNESAERLYGMARDTLAGRRPAEVILQGDAPGPWRSDQPAIERHRRAGGEEFTAEVTASPVCTDDGTQVGTAAVIRDVTARQAELENAAFMRAVVGAAAEGIIGLDENDVIRVFSPAAERIYGWRAGEIVGRHVWEITPEHLRERTLTLREMLATGETVEREALGLRKDGSAVPIRLNASPIRADDGRYLGAAVIVLDLTIRRRAQREAEQARRLLHHVLDHTPGIISVKDRSGRYQLLNRNGVAALGRAVKDVIGHTDFELYAEEDARRSRAEDLQVLETGEPLVVAREVAAVHGEIRTLLVTKFLIPGADPSEDRVGVVGTDVSEIRRGEADRARLEAIVRAAPDAIMTIDADGRIRSWNPGAERIFGLTADAAIGSSITALVPEAELEREKELRERVLRGELITVRQPALRADGTVFPVEASAAVMVGAEGTPMGIVALVRDISGLIEQELELREHAERLERSNADLEAFAYAASHDLQEPLRSIRLAADALMRSMAGRIDADERGLLGHVETAATRAGAQVDALLRLARVALGHVPPEPVPLDVALEDACNTLRAAIRESGAEIVVRGELPAARMSRAELSLLLQNMLANAIKFHRPGVTPRIEISGAVAGGYVELRIADNGVGLSTQDRTHLFAIFGRGRDDVPGTGMGLAVCQRMVNRRGGSITAHSEGRGKGSEFVLRLPQA
jgi:PAS domain S-box-containing protein